MKKHVLFTCFTLGSHSFINYVIVYINILFLLWAVMLGAASGAPVVGFYTADDARRLSSSRTAFWCWCSAITSSAVQSRFQLFWIVDHCQSIYIELKYEKPICKFLLNLCYKILLILQNKCKTAKEVFVKPCETRICETCETWFAKHGETPRNTNSENGENCKNWVALRN